MQKDAIIMGGSEILGSYSKYPAVFEKFKCVYRLRSNMTNVHMCPECVESSSADCIHEYCGQCTNAKVMFQAILDIMTVIEKRL